MPLAELPQVTAENDCAGIQMYICLIPKTLNMSLCHDDSRKFTCKTEYSLCSEQPRLATTIVMKSFWMF